MKRGIVLKSLFGLCIVSVIALLACNKDEKPMSPEPKNESSREVQLKLLTNEWFEAFNRHDLAYIESSYDVNATLEDPDHPNKPLKGNKAIANTYRQLFTYVPDVHDSVYTMIADSNKVAVEFISTGTSGGGGSFKMRIGTILEFNEANKIIRDATYYDK
jgi:hypothetical protein